MPSTEYSLRTFADIYNAVREALGIQAADTNAVNKIKRFVNMYYLNEVVPLKNWSWLKKNLQVVHGVYFNVGTVQVTPGETAIVFNTPPNSVLGSFVGYKFSTDGSNKIYEVLSHTAGSVDATLISAYQENINAASNFKLWRDRVDLPTNAKETIQITHAEQTEPLIALGSQAFRKYEISNPKREGFPSWYNTDTFFNPSDVEGEDDRYRQVRVWPAITTQPVTLSIDYIEEALSLIEDTDEPIMPLEDRIVIYYGACSQAWSGLQRNEEMSDKMLAKANAKLARMAGERDDGYDVPKMTPDGAYVNSQRNKGMRRRRYGFASAGQTSVPIPSYLKDVTIAGGTLTANLIVNQGVLIAGIDINALATSENLTTVNLLDNASNQVVQTWALSMYNAVHVDYAITRGGSTIEVGHVILAGTNSASSISQGPTTNVGDVGTTLSTDVSAASIRLLASTSSTGSGAVITFKVRPWLG